MMLCLGTIVSCVLDVVVTGHCHKEEAEDCNMQIADPGKHALPDLVHHAELYNIAINTCTTTFDTPGSNVMCWDT